MSAILYGKIICIDYVHFLCKCNTYTDIGNFCFIMCVWDRFCPKFLSYIIVLPNPCFKCRMTVVILRDNEGDVAVKWPVVADNVVLKEYRSDKDKQIGKDNLVRGDKYYVATDRNNDRWVNV